ncbi:MAG: hypothetical protein GY821_09465 [Gammaproteobacteria bacterium]|nr:hypothetical protein [Gammaproteobacteria bacterium]
MLKSDYQVNCWNHEMFEENSGFASHFFAFLTNLSHCPYNNVNFSRAVLISIEKVEAGAKGGFDRENVQEVRKFVLSQEDKPGTCLSQRKVARKLQMSGHSVQNAIKLRLKCFSKVPFGKN